MQYNTVSATGSFTARQVEEFSFDLMICSCAAVKEGEVYERSLEQREIKNAARKRSKHCILLFDSTKYNGYGAYKSGNLSDFDAVISDSLPPDKKGYEGCDIIC